MCLIMSAIFLIILLLLLFHSKKCVRWAYIGRTSRVLQGIFFKCNWREEPLSFPGVMLSDRNLRAASNYIEKARKCLAGIKPIQQEKPGEGIEAGPMHWSPWFQVPNTWSHNQQTTFWHKQVQMLISVQYGFANKGCWTMQLLTRGASRTLEQSYSASSLLDTSFKNGIRDRNISLGIISLKCDYFVRVNEIIWREGIDWKDKMAWN